MDRHLIGNWLHRTSLELTEPSAHGEGSAVKDRSQNGFAATHNQIQGLHWVFSHQAAVAGLAMLESIALSRGKGFSRLWRKSAAGAASLPRDACGKAGENQGEGGGWRPLHRC
jgi:hypothetical protein